MTRLYGWAPLGQPCLDMVPHGHWKTATFIAALRYDSITAPLLLDAPMNGKRFLTYIQKILLPELRPTDIVICDNLASHKVQGVKEAIESAGAKLLYLPPYSPDFNPIEMAFSKLKSFLRKTAQRTFSGLKSSVSKALKSFTQYHCMNFFSHSNYKTT